MKRPSASGDMTKPRETGSGLRSQHARPTHGLSTDGHGPQPRITGSMTDPSTIRGVLSPVIMPFTADLTPDAKRLVTQCRWLLSQGCGIALFGTTGEANSLSVEEKIDLLDALVDGGICPRRMMAGTGLCALTDTVRLTAHAVNRGCAGVLMLPPFYYKGVTEDGLFRSYAEVIERVGDPRLHIYLYHIPSVAQVSIPLSLIERLVRAYPGTVVGIKDSGGDWAYHKAILERFPGFHVFCGSETVLLKTMRGGGAGCISATANINGAAIHKLFSKWRQPDAEGQQSLVTHVRSEMQKYPMIPALKQVVAHYSGDMEWTRVRPPLVELEAQHKARLIEWLETRKFTMPNLRETAA